MFEWFIIVCRDERVNLLFADAVKRGSPLRSSRWKVGYVIAFMKCVLVVFNVNIAVTLPFMVGSRGALLHTVRAFNNETVQNQNLSISANEEQYYKVRYNKSSRTPPQPRPPLTHP